MPTPNVESQTFDRDAILGKIREAQKVMPQAEATMLTADTAHGCLGRDGKIYVPKSAKQIKIDLLIMSHCGPAGRRGQAVTANHVKTNFTWTGIGDDIKTFVNKFLHCQSTKGQIRVTRE